MVSKLYNKKIVFNLVNLKYIHLNSDILLHAIKTRLRDYKKNRVTTVFSKVLSLVKVAKINEFTYDIHSPAYKYIAQHFNKFKFLNNHIFNDVQNVTPSNESIVPLARTKFNASAHRDQEQASNLYKPHNAMVLKNLNHVQTSTINFIKYKSVFGVRLEGSGRLTKRSTASRSIFKIRYIGNLKNNVVLNRSLSSVILNNNRISNLQFTKISSKTRNGSYGLKG